MKTIMHRPLNTLILLAALMMVFVPSAFAQDVTPETEVEVEKTCPDGYEVLVYLYGRPGYGPGRSCYC